MSSPIPPAPPEGHCCPSCYQPVGASYVATRDRWGWTYWHPDHVSPRSFRVLAGRTE